MLGGRGRDVNTVAWPDWHAAGKDSLGELVVFWQNSWFCARAGNKTAGQVEDHSKPFMAAFTCRASAANYSALIGWTWPIIPEIAHKFSFHKPEQLNSMTGICMLKLGLHAGSSLSGLFAAKAKDKKKKLKKKKPLHTTQKKPNITNDVFLCGLHFL